MTQPQDLIGLEMDEAARVLSEGGQTWREVPYADPKGVPGADSRRVVRATAAPDGVLELVVCAFKTGVSQG